MEGIKEHKLIYMFLGRDVSSAYPEFFHHF